MMRAAPVTIPLRELRGVLERITYQNPENGYTVARLAPERADAEANAARRDDRLVTVVGTLTLLVLVLVLPESITKRGGAERWITIGPGGIQPTEVAKLGLVVYLASWLMGRGAKLRSATFGLM